MQPKLHSAVVTAENEDVPVFVSLLSGQLHDKIEFIYYSWPSQIDPRHIFDVIIVHDSDLILEILERYPANPPTIIHLDQEPVRADYAQLYPPHKVVRIKQAALDRLDYTLQLAAFEDIINHLYAHK